MYQMQATVAMEQYIIGTAAAGTCFGTRSKAVSTHQGLITEPHTRTSRRMPKDRQRRTFYIIEDLTRSIKIFKRELPMSIREELSHKHHRRASSRSQCKDLFRRTSAGSAQDLPAKTCRKSCKDTERISPGPLPDFLTRTCTRSCKRL